MLSLHGVTGSGKTRVYMNIVKEKLKKNFSSQNKKFKDESNSLKKEESELIKQKKSLSPEEYKKGTVKISKGQNLNRRSFILSLVNIHYSRNDLSLIHI